jgi:hypothetical protein
VQRQLLRTEFVGQAGFLHRIDLGFHRCGLLGLPLGDGVSSDGAMPTERSPESRRVKMVLSAVLILDMVGHS